MRCSFPYIGVYSRFFYDFLRDLGVDVVMPLPVTKKTIRLGVKHSPDMICFPYKVCLGSTIECLENGAERIIWPDTQGTCRFTHFSDLQTKVLRGIGYKYDVLLLRKKSIFSDLKSINPKLSWIGLFRKLRSNYQKMKQLEDDHFFFEMDESKVNIGLVGEIYTLFEPTVNHNIISLLRKMDVNVHLGLKMSDFFKKSLKIDFAKKGVKKESRIYLEKDIGGHGRQSVYNTLYYADNGFDGVIHLMPLTCMPETTVQPALDIISRDRGIPVYSFPLDENNSEAGFKTRLETFVSVLKKKKGLL